MFPLETGYITQFENTVHIFRAFKSRFTGLSLCILFPYHALRIQRNPRHRRYTTGNPFTLIVSSQLLFFLLAKLLQKSEMRKDIVIELSYKGFG